MIDMNKQYTYNGKPVRIYADGRDCSLGLMHGAYQRVEDGTWYCRTFLKSELDLVEAWEPKEDELCYFWDNGDTNDIVVSKFVKMQGNRYESLMCSSPFDNCAPFKGELPEAFKGLTSNQ